MIRDRDFIKPMLRTTLSVLIAILLNRQCRITTTTSGIMSSVDGANRQAAMAKWMEDYQRDIKTLQSYIATTQSDVMKDVYQRSLKAMRRW